MFGKYAKCCDKVSFAVPDEARGEMVKAPCLEPQSSRFGAVREERNGSSPLPDGMRCPLAGTDQGGTAETTFRP